jgi:type II secretory pathway pseudopilin PulG
MPTGERGFTYLWLLFVLAIGAAALATAAQRWSHVVARDRERELLFRGQEIARAIASYRDAGGGALPRSLEELVEDSRAPQPRRHLRRAYADPFTGQADWMPVLGADGGWRGVHSRARAPALIAPRETDPGLEAEGPPKVSDHRFLAVAARAASAAVPAEGAAPLDAPSPNGSGLAPRVNDQSPPAATLPR